MGVLRKFYVDGKPYWGDTITKPVVSNAPAWVAGGQVTFDLPRDGIITEIRIRANIAMTAVLAAATTLQDAMRRVLGGVTIKGDQRFLLSFTGGVLLQQGRFLSLLNKCDFHCVDQDRLFVGGTTQTFATTFIWHPGFNKNDRFDLSCAIPAKLMSNPQLIIDCPPANVVDTAGTILAGATSFYSVEVDEVTDVPVGQFMMLPAGLVEVKPHVANAAAYSFLHQVPAGSWIRRIGLMITDATATPAFNRSDAPVGGFAMTLPKATSRFIESLWLDLKASTARRYGLTYADQERLANVGVAADVAWEGQRNTPLGFAVIDLTERCHPFYGMNMIAPFKASDQPHRPTGIPFNVGDALLGETVQGFVLGDVTNIYWDMVQPMPEGYIGR